MLFADDTLILCGADVNQFQNLRCLLLCFEAVSRLKVNLCKSEVIPIGNVPNVQELVLLFRVEPDVFIQGWLGYFD